MTQSEFVTIARRGRAGRITLNRPKALNALTHEMTLAVAQALEDWREDPAVELVVIDGAEERAFCAGGDIRAIYEMGQGGEAGRRQALEFFRDEYRLNWLIATYPKPYVALIDGVTMGGGVGVSIHGSHRVATERTLFAMPETAIGFSPDIGATHFLPRLPRRAGYWMALTGARLGAAETCALGLATHYSPSDGLEALIAALETEEGTVDSILAAHCAPPPEPEAWAERTDSMAAAFSMPDLETVSVILEDMQSGGSDWAGEQLEALRGRSPTSLKLCVEAMRRGEALDLAECLKQELRIVAHCLTGHDFYEGVRAQIVEKDRNPRWSPDSLEAVSDADIAPYFNALPPELELPIAESS